MLLHSNWDFYCPLLSLRLRWWEHLPFIPSSHLSYFLGDNVGPRWTFSKASQIDSPLLLWTRAARTHVYKAEHYKASWWGNALWKLCGNRTCDTDARREKSIADGVLKLCLFTRFLLCSDVAKGTIRECPTRNWPILRQVVPQGRKVWKRQGEGVNKEQRIAC